MNKFLAILLIFFISSCAAFKTQYITLSPELKSQKSFIGKNKKLKLDISYTNSSTHSGVFGYRIPPNINGDRQGAIHLDNKFSEVLEEQFRVWLKSNKFRVSNNAFNTLEIKIGYFNYQPYGGATREPIIRSAIKVSFLNSRNKELFSDWYFVEKKISGENITKIEVNEKYINQSIEELLQKVFSDKKLINIMSK